jgi:acyl-[acyl-carrier-protein]-phospholipid O-acyltransferase/long-chain-fatty-acid--[acyl-carrier-protein] ligase
MKIYDGPAFLAARTGAAVLPVRIDGALLSPFSRLKEPFPQRWFPKIRLTVFPVEYFPVPEARTGKLRRRITSNQMRRMMERTIFETRKKTTIHEAFLDAVDLYGKDTEILDDVRKEGQSYGDLVRASLALGRIVAGLSKEGETVGVLTPNAGATVGLVLGMMMQRRIPAMLNYSAGVEGMQVACDAARIRTVITSKAFLERARLTEKIDQLRHVEILYLEDLRTRFGLLDKIWLMGWALRAPRRTMLPTRAEEPAVVLFTSGSEGKPKGVVLSHDSVLANVAQIRAVIEFSNRDKFLSALPMFHSFGLTACVLLPLVSGARIWLYPSPLHFRLIPELVYDSSCTVLFGTPSFLARYGQAAHPYDFRSTRYVVAGAEKLSGEVRQLWMEKFGIRILEGYGATECSPVLSVNTPLAAKPGTVGVLLPGIEHKVVPVPGIDDGGALHVRGPNVMLGYWRHTAPGVLEPPSSSVGEGWYDTGDVVEVDEEGFVSIRARLKRFAKVAGEMVSLEAVERIAAAAISKPRYEFAASTKPQENRGEIVVLFTQDPELNRATLRAAAAELGLPELAVPRRIELVDKLPRLGTGKVDYVTLKKMAEALA